MGKRIPIVVNGRREILWNEEEQRIEEQDSAADHFQNPTTDLSTESIMSIPQYQPAPEEEQHRAAERSYWRRQNWITGVAAGVGLAGLIALFCTLRITRETMIHAERAWVAYNDLYGPGVTEEEKSTLQPVNNELRLRLEFVNVGNGPAMDVITSAGGWILPKDGLTCHYQLRDEPPESVAVLPGRGIGHPLYSGATIKDATDANIKAVNDGIKILLVGGIVNRLYSK